MFKVLYSLQGTLTLELILFSFNTIDIYIFATILVSSRYHFHLKKIETKQMGTTNRVEI